MSNILQKLEFENLEFLMFVIDEMAEELENNSRDIIRLTLGKSQEPLHPDIIDSYTEAITQSEKRNVVYPQGLPELRKSIAAWYTSMGNPTADRNVVINTGTSPLFKDMFRFLLDEGDEVLLPYPYYSVYNVSALLTAARINYYHVNPQTLQIDFEDFEAKFSPGKTKIVVLNSPGNPFGNILSKKDFQHILQVVDGNAYIISDEIYRNVSFNGEAPSILEVSTKRDKIIVSNSFSKGFRMYTTRVGFFILPDELIEPFRVLLQHTLLTANAASQYACITALKLQQEVADLTNIYKARNYYAFDTLSSIGAIKVIKALGGFYFVITCDQFMAKRKICTSLELAQNILKETGVALVPGSDFGMDNALRVSFTNTRFNEAIDRLKAYFANNS